MSKFSVLRSPFSVLRSPFSVLRYSLICVPVLLLAVTAAEVRAANITIDTDETATNGGQALTSGGGDTITVTGSITISGNFNHGISANSDNSTILNKAGISITTTGQQANGILVANDNKITNEAGANIRAEGAGAKGIYAQGNRNQITNRGRITTLGDPDRFGVLAEGILTFSDNTIINEAGGAINTQGAGATGIYANGNNNQITNRGRITIAGNRSDGIRAVNDNTIRNGGKIITEGQNARGISVNSRNRITNEAGANISTARAEAYGIYANGEANRITNAGRIHTQGARALGIYARGSNNTIQNQAGADITITGPQAHGIELANNNRLTHAGRIHVAGPGAAGIRAGNGNELRLDGAVRSARGPALVLGDNNTVRHSGNDTLRSTAEDTPAVMMGDGNTLTNTGRIEATGRGANAHAITAGSNNTINNHGTIRANGGKAINFTGANNTLNLLPGAVLIGDINRGVNGRVNITVAQAPAYSVLWEDIAARPEKGSAIPFFYNAQSRQLATWDSRPLAAAMQALGDISANVSGLMARPSGSGYGPPALSPHTGLPVHNRRNLNRAATGSAFWLGSFGNRARYREQTGLRPESGHLGLAAGYDLRLDTRQLGVLAGYGRGELRLEGAERFKPGPSVFKGPFAAFYIRRDFDFFWAQLGLAGGALRQQSSRLVNDNLAPDGQARAEAETRSWWLSPEARIGLRLNAGLMRFEPSFTARYARQSVRRFTETGIRAPASIARRTVELVETRLELKAGRDVGPGHIALRFGWQYRDDLNSNQARVRLLGESQRIRLASGLGGSLYLGAEAEFELAPGLFLALSGEAVSGNGYRNLGGMATLYKRF